MAVFANKTEVKLFVCQKSVDQSKPFRLMKSEPGRYVVRCTKKTCVFKLVFVGNGEGVFSLVEESEHSCRAALPTIKRIWICQKALELGREQKVTPQRLKRYIKREYQVDAEEILIRNSLACSKKDN